MHDLALQVGQVDDTVIDDGEAAHPGRAEVERHGRPQSSGADHQHPSGQDAGLPLHPDVVEEDVSAVAQELVVIHGGSISGFRRRQ